MLRLKPRDPDRVPDSFSDDALWPLVLQGLGRSCTAALSFHFQTAIIKNKAFEGPSESTQCPYLKNCFLSNFVMSRVWVYCLLIIGCCTHGPLRV